MRQTQEFPPLPSIQELRVIDWNFVAGDTTLRLNYPLNEQSIVIDLGAYHGDFAQEISDRYGSRLYLFEPVPEYISVLQQRFQSNKCITVLPFAVGGGGDGTIRFSLDGDRTSAFRFGHKMVIAPVRNICQVLDELGLKGVSLLKINVEGAEFEILDALIASGWISKIADIQVQFHDFVPDAIVRLNMLRSKLGLTHYPTYMHSFVWENWRRRIGCDLESVAMESLSSAASLRERSFLLAVEVEIQRRSVSALHARVDRITPLWWFQRLVRFLRRKFD